MRFEKKKEIVSQLESLQIELNEYLQIWRKSGGGTTGHAIGSMIESIKKKTEFFKNCC